MVEFFVRLFFFILWFASIQIAWNALVYKQKGGFTKVKYKLLPFPVLKNKWVNFALWFILLTAVYGLLYHYTTVIIALPVISAVVGFLDSLWRLFTYYLKPARWGLMAWFLLIPILAFVYFTIVAYIDYIQHKRAYIRYTIEQQAKEQAENPPKSALEVAQSNAVSVSAEEIVEKAPYEPVKRFVTEPLTSIRYTSALGIMKSYNDAKKKGLLIGETDTGYVAVFASEKGLHDMRAMLSKYSLDIAGLPAKPSIVFFDEDNVEAHSIREYAEELSHKQGGNA